jgi:hypothetical protein
MCKFLVRRLLLSFIYIFVFAFPPIAEASMNVEQYSYLRPVEIKNVSVFGKRAEAAVKNNGALSRYVRLGVDITGDGGKVFHSSLETVLRPSEEKNITATFPDYLVTDGKTAKITATAGNTKNKFYVSPSGNDGGDGSFSSPFKTLERVREAVKSLKHATGLPYGGVTVYLRGGSYTMENTFSLDETDSGYINMPVTYSAYNNEKVVIKGSNTIPPSAFVNAGLSNPNILKADLNALGITDFGAVTKSNAFTVVSEPPIPSSTMLYVDNDAKTLARYPNSGALKTGSVTPASNGNSEHTVTFKHNITAFNPSEKWAGEEVWARGFWQYNWYEDALKVNVSPSEVTLSERTAYGIKSGQDYYFYNILAELDVPGEFYVSRQDGFLYYYPESGLTGQNIELTFLKTPLISLKNAKNIRFEGLEIENSRFSGIVMENCENVSAEGSEFHGLGGQAVRITGGKNCGVLSCDIYNIGRGGVRLEGGDRNTLTPAGHFAENCDIYDFCLESATYTPAVYLGGVGNIVRNCKIHDGPHMGAAVSGNGHLIENSEFYGLCDNSSDAGAIYGGRDWTQCGNVIKGNYFHDIQGKDGVGDSHCVYFDDMMSGNTVSENIFYNVYSAVFMHGGRSTDVKDNLIINAVHSVWQHDISNFNNAAVPGSDLRNNYNVIFTENGVGEICTSVSEAWLKYNGEPTDGQPLYRRLDKIPYDQPNYPKYNMFTGNILYNSGNIAYTARAAESGYFLGNVVNGGTLDIASVDISGIGIYSDQYRE